MDIKDYKEREFNNRRIGEIISSVLLLLVGIFITVVSITKERDGCIVLGGVMIIAAVLIALWSIYLLKKNNEGDF